MVILMDMEHSSILAKEQEDSSIVPCFTKTNKSYFVMHLISLN